MMKSKFVGLGWVGALGIVAVLSGCGKGGAFSFVQDAKVEAYQLDDGAYVELSTLLDTGALDFGVSLPLVDPKRPGERYGTLSLRPSLEGPGSELSVAVNVTRLIDLPGTGAALLPNGTPIPVAGLSGPVIALQAGSLSRVYVSVDPQNLDRVMIGTALVVREFDQIAKNLPGVNIFPAFQISETVRGVAGLFTGAAPDQSGIAVFVSAVLKDEQNESSEAQGGEVGAFRALGTKTRVDRTRFLANDPTPGQERTVGRALYRIQKRDRRMTVR